MTTKEVQTLITVATPVLVWACSYIPRMPPKVLPVLAPIVGAVLGAVAYAVGLSPDMTPIDATQAGAAGVFVREVINQWITKPVNEKREERAAELDARAPLEKPPSSTP